MNEQSLKKRLKKATVGSLLLAAWILVTGAILYFLMYQSLNRVIADQMETETQEYKRRILRQLDKDFQTLNSLASFLDSQDQMLAESLYNAKSQNEFVSMAFFDRDGMGIMVHSERGILTEVDYHTLSENVQETLEKAYDGGQGVSQLFDSEVTDKRIFVYSVPVYDKSRNGTIAGVLSASNDVETFQDILDGDSVMNGGGAVHLIRSNGKMLLSTTAADPSVSDEDLFHSVCFTEEAQEQIHQAVSNGENLFTKLTYQKKMYHVYLCPVGVNDWYIMCVNRGERVNAVMYRILRTMGITFALLLVTILFLLLYICHLVVRNNRKLTRLAYYDSLTGADNLARFNQRLEQTKKEKNGFCLVSINVRQFKFITEIFGAGTADRMVCEISKGISQMLQDGEYYCREIQDQFYMVLLETEKFVLQTRLQNLIDGLQEKIVVEKKDYQVLLYAGLYIYNGAKSEADLSNEALITRTRFALQYCQNLPGTQIYFYDMDIHRNEELENYVETHMQQALEKGEFRMYLQPLIAIRDGSLGGAEALVRWITEDGFTLYPDEFIPQFERNGFSAQLDMYIVELAFSQIRQWLDADIEPVPISVNQSRQLFYKADYIAKLQQLSRKYRVDAGMIILEITEGFAAEGVDEMNAKLRRLHSLGFKIAMGHFGSGDASFNTLGKLEIDELKLDRALLLDHDKETEARFQVILEYIVQLAKKLNISVVAEGVETQEHRELLQKLRCDFGQGYFYSQPVCTEEFTREMKKHRNSPGI